MNSGNKSCEMLGFFGITV